MPLSIESVSWTLDRSAADLAPSVQTVDANGRPVPCLHYGKGKTFPTPKGPCIYFTVHKYIRLALVTVTTRTTVNLVVQADDFYHSYARQERPSRLEIEADIVVQSTTVTVVIVLGPNPRLIPWVAFHTLGTGRKTGGEVRNPAQSMFCKECYLPLPIQNIVGQHGYGCVRIRLVIFVFKKVHQQL